MKEERIERKRGHEGREDTKEERIGRKRGRIKGDDRNE